MGGGKSSTQANQQTSNVQDIDTTTTSLEDVEFGIAGVGGNVSVTTTDSGAVDRAFDFGEDVLTGGLDRSLDFGHDALSDSLDFARANVGDSFDFGESALDSVGDAYEGALDRSLDFGEDATSKISSAVGKVLDFASRSADAANEAQGKALSALGTGITQVSDASRSDTTDAFRRIVQYVAIAGALVGIAYFIARRKG